MEDRRMAYYVYGSYNGGRFKAMDLNACVQVGNLIYATIFWDEEKERAEKILKEIRELNPEWKFELRKAG